jgi:hypothetical protein
MAVAPMAGLSGGGNPSGFNPTGGSAVMNAAPQANPIVATFPSGTTMPPQNQALGAFPANTGGVTNPAQDPLLSTLTNPAGQSGASTQQWQSAMTSALHKAGYPSAVAAALAGFIGSGSGFSPAVMQALMASLQPQVNRGEADIMEQFGSQGLGQGSSAAIGMGDYLSQVNLNEQQIASQMYEQSIQNTMSILTGAKKQQQPSGIGALLGGAGGLLSGLSDLGLNIGGGGGSGNSTAGGGGDLTALTALLAL